METRGTGRDGTGAGEGPNLYVLKDLLCNWACTCTCQALTLYWAFSGIRFRDKSSGSGSGGLPRGLAKGAGFASLHRSWL